MYHQLASSVALSAPADKSLMAMIKMQQSLISSPSDEFSYDAKFSRVLTRLSIKVIKDGEARLDGLKIDELRAVLSSIDSLMELAKSRVTNRELSASVEQMAKHLVLKLLARRADLRVAVDGLDCSGFVEPFLSECEQMIESGEGIPNIINVFSWRERLAQHNRIAQRDVIW